MKVTHFSTLYFDICSLLPQTLKKGLCFEACKKFLYLHFGHSHVGSKLVP